MRGIGWGCCWWTSTTPSSTRPANSTTRRRPISFRPCATCWTPRARAAAWWSTPGRDTGRGWPITEGTRLSGHTLAGSFDAAPFPGFEALAGEPEIHKRRYSAFFGTDLALLLAEQGTRELMIGGVKTNVCIRASVQDAFANGIRPILVEGTVNCNRPHLHEAALEDVRRYFGEVIGMDEALRRLLAEDEP